MAWISRSPSSLYLGSAQVVKKQVDGDPLAYRAERSGKGVFLYRTGRVVCRIRLEFPVGRERAVEAIACDDFAVERLSLAHFADEEARRCYSHRQHGSEE